MTDALRRRDVIATFGAVALWSMWWANARPAAQQSPLTLGLEGHANTAPSIAANGRLVVLTWVATKDGSANVYMAVSRDAGASFSAPRRVNDVAGEASANPEQPPRAAIAGSPKAPSIWVMWSQRGDAPNKGRRDVIRFTRSSDGGATFLAARLAHDATWSGARGWHSLAAGSNGTVHAVWLDGRNAESEIASRAASGSPHKGQPPQDVVHVALTADGQTRERVIARDVCFCCKTSVAVGADGAVHAAWRHIFPNSMRDIAFARMAAGQATFGAPARVALDNWQLNGCPEDGPSLAVTRQGAVHITWATVVDVGGEQEKAVFYATSRDGRTFSPRARVPNAGSTNTGHPQLALAEDGVVIAWDEVVGGMRRVAVAKAAPAGAFTVPRVLSGEESASNPVIATVTGGQLVAWTSRPAVREAGSREPAGQAMIRVARLTSRSF